MSDVITLAAIGTSLAVLWAIYSRAWGEPALFAMVLAYPIAGLLFARERSELGELVIAVWNVALIGYGLWDERHGRCLSRRTKGRRARTAEKRPG
ncbi:hypothetical protein [Kineosporia sp. A_224]|uniref:hypothetical protein n=1 Tax=Kineosporia sp. A_224 TaxID=1962180 RepID=UPI000B4A5789|nr:hypothetical protein [Kineosporia sp. A_224]